MLLLSGFRHSGALRRTSARSGRSAAKKAKRPRVVNWSKCGVPLLSQWGRCSCTRNLSKHTHTQAGHSYQHQSSFGIMRYEFDRLEQRCPALAGLSLAQYDGTNLTNWPVLPSCGWAKLRHACMLNAHESIFDIARPLQSWEYLHIYRNIYIYIY